MSQTVRIEWKHFLSRDCVSVRPSNFFIREKHPKPRGNRVAARVLIWMNQRPTIDRQRNRQNGGLHQSRLGAADPSNSDNLIEDGGVCVCVCACACMWCVFNKRSLVTLLVGLQALRRLRESGSVPYCRCPRRLHGRGCRDDCLVRSAAKWSWRRRVHFLWSMRCFRKQVAHHGRNTGRPLCWGLAVVRSHMSCTHVAKKRFATSGLSIMLNWFGLHMINLLLSISYHSQTFVSTCSLQWC